MTTALVLLRSARHLLRNPGSWTQRVHTRNALGQPCYRDGNDISLFSETWVARNPETGLWHPCGPPVSRCLLGALCAAARGGFILEAVQELTQTLGIDSGTLSQWNDEPSRTQEEVLDLLDKTLARLEETQ